MFFFFLASNCKNYCMWKQGLLNDEAAHAVKMLLPEYVNGDLSALCVWPDQVRHWYKYKWTSPLHFIDTPDKACNFDYESKSNASKKRDVFILSFHNLIL